MNLLPKEHKEPKVSDPHEAEARKEPSLSEPSVLMPHESSQPKSSAYVRVHGDMVKDMKIGKKIAMKGSVRSMSPSVSHADHYDVEIGEPYVEHIDEGGDDENLATMPKEKLKKKIMPKDGNGY